jgi:platelet-activating factor acetylhydrolase
VGLNGCHLQVETVLFTLYYPSTNGIISTKEHHLWVPRPLGVVGAGYARFAHISNVVTDSIFTFALWLLVGRTRIPAQVDVPLHGSMVSLQTPSNTTQAVSSSDTFPVMVFSHGFASSRTQYTQYLGELASRGFVVAALEHRDGSGPGTVIMKQDSENVDRLMFALRHLR